MKSFLTSKRFISQLLFLLLAVLFIYCLYEYMVADASLEAFHSQCALAATNGKKESMMVKDAK